MDIKSKIILIAGPTASGKSDFAIRLAKKINGELINADSMQIYKQLKILTARPQKKEQEKIKHHLYGFQNVNNSFSTGKWLKSVLKKVKQIKQNNKIPIIVGGTGLYFKSLTEGFVKIPNIKLIDRTKVRLLQKNIGQNKFYQKLIKLDPMIKNKINSNDVQRSIRAYEIKKFTKKSIIYWFKKTEVMFDQEDFIKLYIDFPRSELLERIRLRVNQMFKQGAINEVKAFVALNVKKSSSVNKVIGIKEIRQYLDGEINLNETKDRIAIKTRQYAKRQTTWANGQMTSWEKIDPKALTSVLKKFN